MEAEREITVKGWYSRGWQTYRRHTKPLIMGSVLLIGLSLLFTLLNALARGGWVIAISQVFIMPVLTVGWLFLCLKGVRNEVVRATHIFTAFSSYGRIWVTYILYILIVAGGVFLLVVPGILWAVKYGMSLFVTMDRSLFVRDAYRYSSAITRGYRWKLFVALLAASALNALSVPFSMGLQKIGEGGAAPLLIFGAVPLLACMFVVTPWIGPSFASAYESLCTAKEEVGHTSDTTGKDS
jgi:uncharacterized membrane protein